uniref:Selenoprotein F n=1 Tax=Neogobius melanostomus TaxID=47308 RepID=A0A8C6UR58_9GOBI
GVFNWWIVIVTKNVILILLTFTDLCPVCVPAQLSAYGAELSSEACREIGFSSNLLCSGCELLGEFSLDTLMPDCRRCCQQEAQLEGRKVSDWTFTARGVCLQPCAARQVRAGKTRGVTSCYR